MYRFQAENRHTNTNSDSNNGLIFSADALVPYETKTSMSKPTKNVNMLANHTGTNLKRLKKEQQSFKGSCFKYLTDNNHLSTDCKSSKMCGFCGKIDVHHRSFSKKLINESAHLTEKVDCMDSAKYASVELGLVSCHETVLMQTALTAVKRNKN